MQDFKKKIIDQFIQNIIVWGWIQLGICGCRWVSFFLNKLQGCVIFTCVVYSASQKILFKDF